MGESLSCATFSSATTATTTTTFNGPPIGNLFNSKQQIKQKHKVMYPQILVQMRIIDFLFLCSRTHPCTDLTTSPYVLLIPNLYLSFMPSRHLHSFVHAILSSIALYHLLITIIYQGVHFAFRHAVHTRCITLIHSRSFLVL